MTTKTERQEDQLREPLLSAEEAAAATTTTTTTTTEGDEPVVTLLDDDVCVDDSYPEQQIMNGGGDHDDDEVQQQGEFSWANELVEMAQLGLPLAISFFCRMTMASTDSAFVGHIEDDIHSPETYLAAAALSDMVVNVLLVPPLAFNQVLNALVGQAVGSGNPTMAGIWLQQSMFWLALTMLPCLAGCFYVSPILQWLAFPTDIAYVAGIYAKYNVIWPIPNGLYQCMRFYFQAQGLPRPAMYNNILFLFVNALLNYIFVFGGPFPGWNGLGFIGAAISLSISRTMQSIVYFCYMFLYKKHHLRTWPGLSWRHHTYARTMEFMKQTVPNIGTLLFQSAANQATTVLVGRLGEKAIAASSALSTVTIPWSGTLSATTGMVSGIRVGFHLGRGDWAAAKQAAWLVLYFITVMNVIMAIIFLPLRAQIIQIATSDTDVLGLGIRLIPAMLISTYLSLVVGNITSGVFSGMGRPIIATLLSFGFELPLSIGGVALYILKFHGDLPGVYWLQAAIGAVEAVIVLAIMGVSNWKKCAEDARTRQEAGPMTEEEDDDDEDENEETANLLVTSPVDLNEANDLTEDV